MKQKIHTIIILLMLTAALLTGCNNEPPKPQAVVINIGMIAETTGFTEELRIRTEAMNQQISDEIKALSAELRKEIEDEKSSFGDSPSDEDKQRIQTLRGQIRKKMIEARKEKNARLTKEMTEVRQSYLDDIMSIAQVIAIEHGASIILKVMGVFWSDGSVDITHEVVERMPTDKGSPHTDREQNQEPSAQLMQTGNLPRSHDRLS